MAAGFAILDAQDHEQRLATRLLHWVTGPVEYCEPCAAQMLLVAAALGTHVGHAPIPPPPELLLPQGAARGINLKGAGL